MDIQDAPSYKEREKQDSGMTARNRGLPGPHGSLQVRTVEIRVAEERPPPTRRSGLPAGPIIPLKSPVVDWATGNLFEAGGPSTSAKNSLPPLEYPQDSHLPPPVKKKAAASRSTCTGVRTQFSAWRKMCRAHHARDVTRLVEPGQAATGPLMISARGLFNQSQDCTSSGWSFRAHH
jgi:hypothetical protein